MNRRMLLGSFLGAIGFGVAATVPAEATADGPGEDPCKSGEEIRFDFIMGSHELYGEKIIAMKIFRDTLFVATETTLWGVDLKENGDYVVDLVCRYKFDRIDVGAMEWYAQNKNHSMIT